MIKKKDSANQGLLNTIRFLYSFNKTWANIIKWKKLWILWEGRKKVNSEVCICGVPTSGRDSAHLNSYEIKKQRNWCADRRTFDTSKGKRRGKWFSSISLQVRNSPRSLQNWFRSICWMHKGFPIITTRWSLERGQVVNSPILFDDNVKHFCPRSG